MRIPFAAALAACVLIGSWTASTQAQNPAGANAPKHGIAVVDVGYIFKEHGRFRATMDGMKKEMESIEEQLKTERARVEQKEKLRDGFNPGTPEFKQADEEVTRMKADFNVHMTNLRKDFLDREATTYFETYTEVNNAVTYYCQRNNIVLVLRFNGEPVNPTRRENVLQEINKPIVYQNNIDITPDILAILNRNPPAGGAQPGVTAPGAPTGTGVTAPPTLGARPGVAVPPR
ncbi:MAG: OmpH family outer membrane protein [Pirellulales bacterium]